MRVVSVSDFSSYLKSLLAEDYALQDIWVQGEVGTSSSSGPGHRYFTIREGNAELHCVMWATHARGAPALRQGMAVMAHGAISYYEARGALQLYVDDVREAGIGQLYLEFERLKARLYAEGLFAPERKRPIPDLPHTIGVVTSLRAAALQDILRTLGMRNPLARVIIANASVQGVTASREVARALDLLNEHGEADVILLARGGGALEELWAFNEEEVAYAIARSVIPVVSGVGHETDITIADFVADWRASTPTAAAMSVSPDSGALAAALTERAQLLDGLMADRLDALTLRADRLTQALGSARLTSRVRDLTRQLGQSETVLDLTMRHRLASVAQRLDATAVRLESLSPRATLARGYAMVRRRGSAQPVTSAAAVAPGDQVEVLFHDGTVAATMGERDAEGDSAWRSSQAGVSDSHG